MKIKKGDELDNWIWIIYCILFILVRFVDNSLFSLCICVMNLLLVFTKRDSIEVVALSSFFMISEVYVILNIFIVVIHTLMGGGFKKVRIKKSIVYGGLFLILSTLINTCIGGNLWNAAFGIGYYAILILWFYSVNDRVSLDKMVKNVKKFLLIEFVITGICVFQKGFYPSDYFYGTCGSDAHLFGFVIIACLIYVYTFYKNNGYKLIDNLKLNLWFYVQSLLMLYLTDAKNIYVGFLFACFVYIIVVMRKSEHKVFISIIAMYMIIFLGLIILEAPVIKNFICQNFSTISIYIYDKNFNYKYAYFSGTFFDELSGPRGVLGYGIGHYGSRVANLFGYESMYRADNTINNFVAENFEAFILPEYEKYASLYSKDIVETIKWRSAVLTYPFSSFISFVAENGVIGIIILINILSSLGGKSKFGFLIVFLVGCSVFDMYFDRIVGVGLILLLVQKSNQVLLVNQINYGNEAIG